MEQTFTIDSIEGNSYIGVPVFSRFGQMQNYNYIVMSPQKKLKTKKKEEDPVIDLENEKFKLKPEYTPYDFNNRASVKAEQAAKLGKSASAEQVKGSMAMATMDPNRPATKPGRLGDPNEAVAMERRAYVTNIMVSFHLF